MRYLLAITLCMLFVYATSAETEMVKDTRASSGLTPTVMGLEVVADAGNAHANAGERNTRKSKGYGGHGRGRYGGYRKRGSGKHGYKG